jgi:hypothetical protein
MPPLLFFGYFKHTRKTAGLLSVITPKLSIVLANLTTHSYLASLTIHSYRPESGIDWLDHPILNHSIVWIDNWLKYPLHEGREKPHVPQALQFFSLPSGLPTLIFPAKES